MNAQERIAELKAQVARYHDAFIRANARVSELEQEIADMRKRESDRRALYISDRGKW